jgi:hypothetical protein
MTASRDQQTAARPSDRRPSRAGVVAALTIGAVSIGWTAVGVPLGIATLDQYGPGGLIFIWVFPAIVLSLTLVGGFVAMRVPANPVGWLLEVAGMCAAVGIFGGTYVTFDHANGAGLPLVVPVAWLTSWTVVTALGILIIYVPLLFPTGRFLSPRWRRLGLAGIAGAVASVVGAAFMPGPLTSAPWIDNPLGIPGAIDVLNLVTLLSNLATPIFFGGAIVGVFVRYRRAGPVERHQLKWFGLVAGLIMAAFLASIPNNGPVSDAAWQLGLLLLPLLPVAIGVAILRYRLWDIDRIVSRTLGWALVSGLLAGLFAIAVVTLEDVLSGITQGQTLAVAGSTLLAAALFGPLRGRVQTAVDTRFDRARYDGERVVGTFAERLRDRVDPRAVEHEITATVHQALRPGSAAVWVRRSREGA